MSKRRLYLAGLLLLLAMPALAQGDLQAESELQTGIALTGKGNFADAIPHLKAASGKVHQEFAASFNLALCYVGTGQLSEAVHTLDELRASGHDTADVNNLLAQSYVGSGQMEKGREAFRRGVLLSPENERLYVFVAQACRAHRANDLEIEVLDLGIKNVPKSARLHYERAVLLLFLDQADEAETDFRAVATLAPESDLAYLATAQLSLSKGQVDDAISQARVAIKNGHKDYMLLAILGEALIRSGVSPGESGFEEAKAALEQSVGQRSNYPSAQIALGRLLLMQNSLDQAIVHLEIGRKMEPNGTAAYASLISAYRRKGEIQKAAERTEQLAKLNQTRAEQISGASGDRRTGYGLSVAHP
ncbi:MAG TPA: tetratricopeptide repeat protein [Terriglobales bacterium]|nr:tetratricopeptide repeat protein [Terriglobales bacterium]